MEAARRGGCDAGSDRDQGEGGRRRPAGGPEEEGTGRRCGRGVPRGAMIMMAAAALALVSPAGGAETDWRCPLFTQEGAVAGTSTPIITSAAGCKTTFSVIAKMTLAPDVEQVTLPIRPQGSTLAMETIRCDFQPLQFCIGAQQQWATEHPCNHVQAQAQAYVHADTTVRMNECTLYPTRSPRGVVCRTKGCNRFIARRVKDLLGQTMFHAILGLGCLRLIPWTCTSQACPVQLHRGGLGGGQADAGTRNV